MFGEECFLKQCYCVLQNHLTYYYVKFIFAPSRELGVTKKLIVSFSVNITVS